MRGYFSFRSVSAVLAVVAVGAVLSACAVGAASPQAVAPPTASASAPSATYASPSAAASASEVPTSQLDARVPLVPVVSFWSTQRSVSLVEIARLWSGLADTGAWTAGNVRFTRMAVAGFDVDGLGRALGTAPGSTVTGMSSAAVRDAVTASASTIGLVRAEDVTPDVRALAVDGVTLFGSERAHSIDDWPLIALSSVPSSFELGSVWSLAAGGDVNLDRSVYVKTVQNHLGPDYPWSGGRAVVTPDCCGINGGPLVDGRANGGAGQVRARFADADLAVVNLEGSAPNDYVYRGLNSLEFTFAPSLLVGLKNAGIDAVSLANNHVRNGGDQGVIDTCTNLDKIGIAHAGAGANTTAARAPVWLSAGGKRIAMLGYSAISPSNWASGSHPGAAPLRTEEALADIRAARSAGADIVIVMPHWGEEYSYSLSRTQRDQAAAFVAAGATLVLGSHSHWVGATQFLPAANGSGFVIYSMGDLLFDLNHDTHSEEGVIVTLSFSGSRLAQVLLEPTIVMHGSQIGLLDPAGDGATVLDAIRAASRRVGR